MKEEKETTSLAREGRLDSQAYQRETAVTVIHMQKKKHDNSRAGLFFPARRQFSIKRSVSASVWMINYTKHTNCSSCVGRTSGVQLFECHTFILFIQYAQRVRHILSLA